MVTKKSLEFMQSIKTNLRILFNKNRDHFTLENYYYSFLVVSDSASEVVIHYRKTVRPVIRQVIKGLLEVKILDYYPEANLIFEPFKYEEEVFWAHKKQAYLGNVDSQYFVAVKYANGNGVKRNRHLAILWFKKAASVGHVMAHYMLGIYYKEGNEVVQDFELAEKYLRFAAEKEEPKAQFALGALLHLHMKKVEEAKEWYQRAARQNNLEAQINLGVLFEEQGDLFHAQLWIKNAAQAGQVAAQYNLGYYYLNGIGVKKDHILALFWLKSAANKGYAKAQNYLGTFYETGISVLPDKKSALFWYEKAANKGNENGKNNFNRLKKNQRPTKDKIIDLMKKLKDK